MRATPRSSSATGRRTDRSTKSRTVSEVRVAARTARRITGTSVDPSVLRKLPDGTTTPTYSAGTGDDGPDAGWGRVVAAGRRTTRSTSTFCPPDIAVTETS